MRRVVLRVGAKLFGGCAVLVFLAPPRFFASDFTSGMMVQVAVAGGLGLMGLVCGHFSD